MSDIRLILRDAPSNVPQEIRLRRAVKALLRQYAFEVVDMEFVPDVEREKAENERKLGLQNE